MFPYGLDFPTEKGPVLTLLPKCCWYCEPMKEQHFSVSRELAHTNGVCLANFGKESRKRRTGLCLQQRREIRGSKGRFVMLSWDTRIIVVNIECMILSYRKPDQLRELQIEWGGSHWPYQIGKVNASWLSFRRMWHQVRAHGHLISHHIMSLWLLSQVLLSFEGFRERAKFWRNVDLNGQACHHPAVFSVTSFPLNVLAQTSCQTFCRFIIM